MAESQRKFFTGSHEWYKINHAIWGVMNTRGMRFLHYQNKAGKLFICAIGNGIDQVVDVRTHRWYGSIIMSKHFLGHYESNKDS